MIWILAYRPPHALRSLAAMGGFLRLIDDRSDDNPGDSYSPNYAHNAASRVLFRLVTRFAWSWQCGGQGFESP
jgi:hypothetical protein